MSGEADTGQSVPDAQSSANACSWWSRGRVHSGWELNTRTRVTSLGQPDGIGTRKPRGREDAYDATGMCQSGRDSSKPSRPTDRKLWFCPFEESQYVYHCLTLFC